MDERGEYALAYALAVIYITGFCKTFLECVKKTATFVCLLIISNILELGDFIFKLCLTSHTSQVKLNELNDECQ